MYVYSLLIKVTSVFKDQILQFQRVIEKNRATTDSIKKRIENNINGKSMPKKGGGGVTDKEEKQGGGDSGVFFNKCFLHELQEK